MGYSMLIPASLIIAIVSIYPLLYGIYLSFRNQHFLKPMRNDFVGFSNYLKLLADKDFINAIGFTLYYTIGIVLFSYCLGMVIALLLNKKIVIRGALRALVLIPWIIPSTVAATNWRWILDSQVGFINTILLNLGIIDKSIAFIADPKYVKNVVVIFGIWKAFPFMTLTLLSGLQGISNDLFEAAMIDGASAWQVFRRITLPLLKPVSFVVITLMCIWTFNNFEGIWLFTEGGPGKYTTTISIFTYKTAFFSSEISYATASGTAMMFFMVVFGVIYMRLIMSDDAKFQKNRKIK